MAAIAVEPIETIQRSGSSAANPEPSVREETPDLASTWTNGARITRQSKAGCHGNGIGTISGTGNVGGRLGNIGIGNGGLGAGFLKDYRRQGQAG